MPPCYVKHGIVTGPGKIRTDMIRTGKTRTCKTRTGKIRIDKIRTDKIRTGEIRTEADIISGHIDLICPFVMKRDSWVLSVFFFSCLLSDGETYGTY